MSFVAKLLFSGPGSHIVFHAYVSNLVFKNLKQLLSLSFHDLDILLRYGMSLHLGLSCDASLLESLYIFGRNTTEVMLCPQPPSTGRQHDASWALFGLIPDDADFDLSLTRRSVWFLHYNVTMSSFVINITLHGDTLCKYSTCH